MKYVIVLVILMTGLYIGMTQLALQAVESIAPYYEHADEIAQQVAKQ
jgi:hypothetical protein